MAGTRHGGTMKVIGRDIGDALDIGTLTVGCALGYLDFRFADTDWRAGRPTLAAWYQGHAKRPSMAASAPRNPA